MSLFSVFYPDAEYPSAYGLPYESLYRKGYRGIIYDIDNTLVVHGGPATPEAVRLFARLHEMGFRTILLSNNREARVKPFADAVGSEYICKAHKPSPEGYYRSMEQMGTDASTTLLVGDQLFTDVWGAKQAGIYSILTTPIHPKEEIQIILKRKLEAVILYFYHRREGKR